MSDPRPETRDLTEDEEEPREAEGVRVVPKDPSPPERFRQDTRKVSGETATHLPEGAEEADRPVIQG